MEVKLNADERIDQLYRDNIQIIQSPSVFSFSLDAVLLANFAEVKQSSKAQIVDLCAGNGAVGLFLSKKTNGHVTMVEIQSRLAEMAERSILLNGLGERYRVLNFPLADSLGTIKTDSVDSIVCNPPYFPNHPDSKKNPNQFLAIILHVLTTSLN
ncbi:methyltransferase [Pediococcus acidilactici]|nr:methyltransferase [Pediococcus acidilactici]